AVHERHRQLHPAAKVHVDGIGYAEAESGEVKTQAFFDVSDRHHDVTQALLAGDESRDWARRLKRLFELNRRTIKRLARQAVRIGEAEEFRHAAKLRMIRGAGVDLH